MAGPDLCVHALGALRVTTSSGEVNLGGPRQRRLLGVLLVHLGSVVSSDRLAEAVFAGAPTDAARTTLRSYVARLRKVLGDAVVTRAPGYQLVLDDGAFDARMFEQGLAEGRRALERGEPATAGEVLRRALALWTGEAYAEFADEDWARAEHVRLAELRVAAQELLVDADLWCGHQVEVLSTIETLRREHPLREAFRAQLVTALYRAGRQADALAELRSFREELAEELGVDPGPALVELERRILAQDPTLAASPAGPDQLRGYRLGARLGTGPTATVRAARLPGLERDLVVKTWRPEVADDSRFIRGFDSTLRRVASLQHPAIVAVHDFWREPGAAHVVMRRLPGGTLQDRLEHGQLPRAEVARLVDRIGAALVAASQVGLVHGQVTPRNVLYDSRGDPVLTNFSIDRATQGTDDATGLVALARHCLGDADDVDPGALVAAGRAADVEEAVRLLRAALAPRSLAPAPRLVNPYQGLRAFGESDAENFFGREAVVDTLVARLGRDSRLLLVVGASGTGKSSVVRAGLMPRLRNGAAPGAVDWFVATMLPGAEPYLELGAALRSITTTEHQADCVPRRDLGGIDRTLRTVVPQDGQLLLVIDQLEELFTLAPDDEQRAFLAAVAHAVSTPDSRLRMVATLRADYYDRPLSVPGFAALVEDATVAIPAMVPAEVEAAVVEPAHRVGREVERPLVAELVAAVSHEPSALPALQLVLYELAERSRDACLRVADYRELGGLEGAIASRAEELYLSLADRERGSVRQMFERLVVVDSVGKPTRRRTRRDELAAEGEAIDRWAAARLLTLDVDPQTRAPTVEVSHEALVREWPRLRGWIEEDRSALLVLGRLREAARTWEEQGRDPLALWRGTNLEAALAVSGDRHDLAIVERDFVDASQAAREEEQAATLARVHEHERTNRRLRLQLAGITFALVAALAGGFLALDQRREAVSARHVATARELAAAAEANLRDDPERSILLALAAVDATRRFEEPVIPEAQEALHRAITSSRVVLDVPGVGGALDWSPDGRFFTSEGPEETGVLDLRDAATGESVRTWQADGVDLNDVAFSPDSRLVATAGDQSGLSVWEVVTGRLVSRSTIPDAGAVFGPSFSPDGSLVAAGWSDASLVRVVETETGDVVSEFPAPDPVDTSFSPDGSRLAVGALTDDHPSFVVDPRTGRQLYEVPDSARVQAVAWSPDGRWLALACGDSTALVVQARTGRMHASTSGHLARVSDVAWTPDSTQLAASSDDGTARVFEMTSTGLHLRHHVAAQDMRGGARAVAFSPDGQRLMTSDYAITSVKVWDLHPLGASEISNFAVDRENESSAVFAADGDSVFVVAPDGRVAEHALDGRVLRRLRGGGADGTMLSLLAPSPDGRLLAAGGWDRPVQVWDLASGTTAFSADLDNWVNDLDWSADSELLAVGRPIESPEGLGSVVVLDRTGRRVGEVIEERGWVTGVDFHAEGDRLAVTTLSPRDPEENRVGIWRWRERDLMDVVAPGTAGAAHDPIGERLGTFRAVESVAELWDADTGERVATLTGHTGGVTDLAFSPDGAKVATSSLDGTVRVWEARTGDLEVSLRGPDTGVVGVQFSPDGSRLLSTSNAGVARLWTLDLDELVEIGKDRLTRGLTDPECRRYLHLGSCPD